jgi:hypothetical protein
LDGVAEDDVLDVFFGKEVEEFAGDEAGEGVEEEEFGFGNGEFAFFVLVDFFSVEILDAFEEGTFAVVFFVGFVDVEDEFLDFRGKVFEIFLRYFATCLLRRR